MEREWGDINSELMYHATGLEKTFSTSYYIAAAAIKTFPRLMTGIYTTGGLSLVPSNLCWTVVYSCCFCMCKERKRISFLNFPARSPADSVECLKHSRIKWKTTIHAVDVLYTSPSLIPFGPLFCWNLQQQNGE